MKNAKRLGIAAASALVTLLVAELALRALPLLPNAYRIYPPGLDQVFRPMEKVMPGVGPEARFRVNSLGFRGDELPGEPCYRILALGGSTTECSFVDQPVSWPQLVGDRLAESSGRCVWVANAGRSGFTSRRHAVQLRHLLEQEPRFDAIVLLVGVNDLCNRLQYGSEEPPEDALTPAGIPVSKCFSVVPRGQDPEQPILKRTALADAAKRLRDLALGTQEYDRIGTKYVRWRQHRRGATEFRPELPELDRALTAYRENLRECAELARAAGVRLVLLTQPSIWGPDLPPEIRRLLWLGGTGNYQEEIGLPYYSAAAMAEGMRRYNDALRAFAVEEDLELIDLAPEIPKDATSFYDDVHFNDEGSRRVADVVVEYFLGREPFVR